MRENPLTLKRMIFLAVSLGIVIGLVLAIGTRIGSRWSNVRFDIDLTAPEDMAVSIVLSQPGRADTVLGSYQGDQTIQFSKVRVLKKEKERIAVRVVPGSDRAIATPPSYTSPMDKTLVFKLEWQDVTRVYMVTVQSSEPKPVAGVTVTTSPDSALASGITDAGGVVELTVRAKPDYRFYFLASAQQKSAFSEAINHTEGEMPFPVPITLNVGPSPIVPQVAMSVQVSAVYVGTEEPVPGVAISTSPRVSESTSTGETGGVTLNVRGQASTQFAVIAKQGNTSKASELYTLEEGATREAKFAFPKPPPPHVTPPEPGSSGVKIEVEYAVRVTRGGQPLSDIMVTAEPGGQPATTGSDGSANFRLDLVSGTTVRFAASVGGETKSAKATHKAGGPGPLTIEFGAIPTFTYVFNATNQASPQGPLAGVVVRIRDADTQQDLGSGTTDTGGKTQVTIQSGAQQRLGYEAIAPGGSGVTCDGDGRLLGSLTRRTNPPPVALKFSCKTTTTIPPDKNTDDTKPPPTECKNLAPNPRITCLYDKGLFDDVMKVDVSGLTGERLSEARIYRGLALTELKSLDKAIAEYKQVIDARSQKAGLAYLNMGKIQMSQADWSRAIETLKEAENMQLSDENLGLVNYNIGICDFSLVQFSKQRVVLIADAKQRFFRAKDLMCRSGGKHTTECQNIEAYLARLDQLDNGR